jgi:hypothetical protein
MAVPQKSHSATAIRSFRRGELLLISRFGFPAYPDRVLAAGRDPIQEGAFLLDRDERVDEDGVPLP